MTTAETETKPQTPDSQYAQIFAQIAKDGNLVGLSWPQRMLYYRKHCEAHGLNWELRPFDFIIEYEDKKKKEGEKSVQLYLNSDGGAQLRDLRNVSVNDTDVTFQRDLVIVKVKVSVPEGRQDADIGIVPSVEEEWEGPYGNRKPTGRMIPVGPARLANVMKTAVTQAKLRATKSICGMRVTDYTELPALTSTSSMALEDGSTVQIAEIESSDWNQSAPALPSPEASPTGAMTTAQRDQIVALCKAQNKPLPDFSKLDAKKATGFIAQLESTTPAPEPAPDPETGQIGQDEALSRQHMIDALRTVKGEDRHRFGAWVNETFPAGGEARFQTVSKLTDEQLASCFAATFKSEETAGAI